MEMMNGIMLAIFFLQSALLVWFIVRDGSFRKKYALDVEKVNTFLPKLEELNNVRTFLEDAREAMSSVENARQTRERFEDYYDHVKSVAELDLYREDEVLGTLLSHSADMVEFLESIKEVYDFDGRDTAEDEEEA